MKRPVLLVLLLISTTTISCLQYASATYDPIKQLYNYLEVSATGFNSTHYNMTATDQLKCNFLFQGITPDVSSGNLTGYLTYQANGSIIRGPFWNTTVNKWLWQDTNLAVIIDCSFNYIVEYNVTYRVKFAWDYTVTDTDVIDSETSQAYEDFTGENFIIENVTYVNTTIVETFDATPEIIKWLNENWPYIVSAVGAAILALAGWVTEKFKTTKKAAEKWWQKLFGKSS